MKKIFTLAIAAAALIGCTKTEANYTEAQQISFAPVSKFDTKAAVTGEKFTADQNFYVFANTVNEARYFEKVSFEPTSESTTTDLTIYSGNPAQYWPNVTALKFAGYTASGNTATAAWTLDKEFESLTVTDYVQPQPTETNAKNDFMWFFECGTDDAGYIKPSTPVTPIMKHACSWITINIEADSDLVTYWEDLKVLNVRFVNLHETGTVTFPNEEGGVASWNFVGKTVTPYVNIRTQAKTIEATNTTKVEFADVLKNTIVLPQPLADANGEAAVKLSVTYSYTTPAGVSGFTEEKVLDLFYDDVKSAWKPGKHYTYNLTLTAEEIKIAPSSADWGEPVNTSKPF